MRTSNDVRIFAFKRVEFEFVLSGKENKFTTFPSHKLAKLTPRNSVFQVLAQTTSNHKKSCSVFHKISTVKQLSFSTNFPQEPDKIRRKAKVFCA